VTLNHWVVGSIPNGACLSINNLRIFARSSNDRRLDTFWRLHSLLFVILMAWPSVQHQALAAHTAFGALMGMAIAA
jgi:hypothetical protein